MAATTNPFPEYPVSRLDEPLTLDGAQTAQTWPITMERQLIDRWVAQHELPPGGSATPLIVAVRGDYGAGKTHLLLDAMAYLRSKFGEGHGPSFLPVATIAGGPLDWYRSVIGPRLAGLPLEELVVELYAKAGQEVADRAKLTDQAVKRLEQEPAAIRDLVGRDYLSSTAVEEAFQRNLDEALSGVPADIVRALAQLRWEGARQAMTWLSGGVLAEVQARLLKLPPSMDSDELALQVLQAVAALHQAAGRTFALFIDEAEHFLRVDTEVGRQNATSMKRLLEGLAPRDAIVFVAGHWSAWQAFPDYLDRFSPSEPVDLLRLTADDVKCIVVGRMGSASDVTQPVLTQEQAALVADLTDGGMRATMSLLRELYELSDGFTGEVTLDEITATAATLKRRPSPESVLLQVHELLERLGFSVVRGQRVAPGIQFDLVASQAGRPRVLVKIKHARHELAQADQLLRMTEQMREVNQVYPEAIGCFVSETRLDRQLQDAIPSGSTRRLLLSDATSPDFINDLSSQLATQLQASEAQTTPPDSLRQASQVAIGNIQGTLTYHEQELDRLLPADGSEPADTVGPRASSLSPPRSEYRDKLGVTYAELTKRPSLFLRLSHIWGGRLLIFVLIQSIGLFGTIFTIAQGSFIPVGSPGAFAAVTSIQYLVSALLILISGFMIIRDVIQVERFYEYRDQRLRSIYLRSDNPDDLIRCGDELQEVFDQAGPRWRLLLNTLQRESDVL